MTKKETGLRLMSPEKRKYISRIGIEARERKRVKRLCSIDCCGRVHFAKTYCVMHYSAVRNGYKIRNTPTPYRNMSATEKVLEYAMPNDSCWEWFGPIDKRGYGKVHFRNKHMKAHRLSYEAYIGNIKEGLSLDHLCENKKCVNPFHLEPVTTKENLQRYWKNRKEYEEK